MRQSLGTALKYATITTATTAAALLLSTASFAASSFAKFSVDGNQLQCESSFSSIGGVEVTGQIEVEALSMAYESPGAIRATGEIVNNPIEIRKRFDRCSPELLQALFRNSVADVEITIFTPDNQTGQTVAKSRISALQGRIVGVSAEHSSVASGGGGTLEVVRVVPGTLIVEDLSTGAAFSVRPEAGAR